MWEIQRQWNDQWEQLYSDWIAHLFRHLPGQGKGWRRLHKVLHNPTRNFLHNRLGLNEDDPDQKIRVRAAADCGDVPYQLRAYFAWKFELPFRFNRCTRGNATKGPRCKFSLDNRIDDHDHLSHPVSRFNAFLQESIAYKVHSGTMRTLPRDEQSDFYPIPLSKDSIRPGTIFVDVRSHVLLMTQWDEQGLWAIDGHPDKTVTRRRFNPRYFRYFAGKQTGGFKAFRPFSNRTDLMSRLGNKELGQRFSTEQYRFPTRKSFNREMKALIARASAPAS